MTTLRSLAAALPDFNLLHLLDPAFFLTISLAFFLFFVILFAGKLCASKARQTFCRFFLF
jgi:hypothetical protein